MPRRAVGDGGGVMMVRRAVAVCAGAVLVLSMGGLAGSAAAAGPPPNDTIGGAIVVPSLPFTDTMGTRAATTDADDAQVNASCGAPLTNNSVWFTFTAGASDTLLSVDTTGSTFSSGVIIATGTPGSLTTQACGPVSSHVVTSPGTTYYILVFDDTGSGGRLQLAMHGPGPQPKNDNPGKATAITALPFSDALDTTGATTGKVDTQANATCGAPATGNSVWYTFTATASDPAIFVDASFSDYNVGVLIATGTPGALTTVACGPFGVTTPTTPGTKYYIMVFDAAGGGGGNLQLNVGEAPTATVQLRTTTPVDLSGEVHLKGSYTCANTTFLDISGSLVEIVGKTVATGFFDNLGLLAPTCDGAKHPWTATVTGATVSFAPGKTAVFLDGLACNDSVCADEQSTQVISLVASGSATSSALAPALRSTATTFRHSPRLTYGTAARSTHATWGRTAPAGS
jgi:hypothetical protein